MKQIGLLLTLLYLLSCDRESRIEIESQFLGTLNLTSSDQLEYVEHESITPSTVSNLDGWPQNVAPALTGSPNIADVSPHAVNNSSASPSLVSNLLTYSERAAGGINEGNENLGLTITKNMNTSTNEFVLTCAAQHSYTGLPANCDIDNVNYITRSSLQTGVLAFSLFNNINTASIKSDFLNSKRWAIKQISNTSGNQTLTDDLKGFYVDMDEYFIFIGATPSGGRKIFSVNQNDQVDQISNTRRNQALHDMTDGYYSSRTMKFKDKFLFFMENENSVRKLSTIDKDRNINYVANLTGNLATSEAPFPMEETYSGITTNIINDEYYIRFSPTGQSRLFKIKNDWTVQQVSNNYVNGDSVGMGAAFNGNYYFRCAVTATNQQKYCRTTSDGKIKILTNLKNNMALADVPTFIMTTENYLYLTMEHTTGVKKLYRLDKNDNFSQISNTSGNQALTDNIAGGSSTNRVLVTMNNCLYFNANNSSAAMKLYKVCDDGVVKQVLNTSGDQNISDAYQRMDTKNYNDQIHLVARNPEGGKKLFVIYADDRSQQVSNTVGNQALDDDISSSGFFTIYKDEFYFVAKNPQGGKKLFKQKLDGKIVQVSNIRSNQALSDFGSTNYMMVWKDALYFDGLNSNGVAKMFKLYLKE